MQIPPFNENLVLPPHLGNPAEPGEVSPYPCTTVELCQRFGTTPERREILRGLLSFRERMRAEGLVDGFQWLDGSFLENVEERERRPPRDLDVVTFYTGYDLPFLQSLNSRFPEFSSRSLAKAQFRLDHFTVDASYDPLFTVSASSFWALFFSHNRQGIWKGMLQIEINTPAEDVVALHNLGQIQP